MATYTTTDYFQGDIAIPNITGSLAPNVAIQNNIARYTFDFEEEFLRLMLGDDFYEEFAAGLAEVVVPAKWTALKNEIWKDTTVSAGPPAVHRYDSPAARYIFFKYYGDRQASPTNFGEVAATAENAALVPSTRRLVQCWNRMVDRVEEIWDWLEDDARSANYTTFSRPYPNYMTRINSFGI